MGCGGGWVRDGGMEETGAGVGSGGRMDGWRGLEAWLGAGWDGWMDGGESVGEGGKGSELGFMTNTNWSRREGGHDPAWIYPATPAALSDRTSGSRYLRRTALQCGYLNPAPEDSDTTWNCLDLARILIHHGACGIIAYTLHRITYNYSIKPSEIRCHFGALDKQTSSPTTASGPSVAC